MTLIQLRYFCETCRCHSITGAAKELFVTQPAISLAIKDLEEEFKITLFTRINNKLILTDDGARFYEKAIYILEYCSDMQLELSKSNKKQPVKIGIPPILSGIIFLDMLEKYMRKYPDFKVSLEEFGSVRACDMVMEDSLDLALVNMEMYNIDRLDSCVLLHDKLVFCVSQNHPLADRESITVADLDNRDIILFNKDSVQNMMLKSKFETYKIQPNIVMQASQLYTMINFIKSGKTGCFLYNSTMREFPQYKAVPLEPPLKTDIGIVWKKGRYITAQMQRFISFAKEYYGELYN